MPKIISMKVLQEYEAILNYLKSFSLLGNDEPLVGGFYPIRIKNSIHFCILTTLQLILATKDKSPTLMKNYNYELIPLKNIESHSFEKYKDMTQLLGGILFFGFVLSLLFLLPPLLKTLEINTYYLLIGILTVLSGLGILAFVVSIHRFFKGENVISLKIPGKILKLQSKFIFLKREAITFLMNSENDLKLRSKFGDIADLYEILSNYIEY